MTLSFTTTCRFIPALRRFPLCGEPPDSIPQESRRSWHSLLWARSHLVQPFTPIKPPPLRRSLPFMESLTRGFIRSEEHTSELQSHLNLVCRLLLEKKKKQK